MSHSRDRISAPLFFFQVRYEPRWLNIYETAAISLISAHSCPPIYPIFTVLRRINALLLRENLT